MPASVSLLRPLRLRGLARAVLLAGAVLLAAAVPAAADPSPGQGGPDGPTEAGTAFRTATAVGQGQTATASASTGDYLYWVFPAAEGQVPTVRATVALPRQARRHGPQRWRIDVYDGLRRRQACTSGGQARTVPQLRESVTLRCTVRWVRAWAQPWANDPLPGAYYVRLAVTRLSPGDLGLPVRAEVTASAPDAGGAHAQGGDLPVPLNPVVRAGATVSPGGTPPSGTGAAPRAVPHGPDDGWGAGWWSDRWIWTVGGGALGALAGLGGYRLSRGRSGTPAPPRASG